MSIVPVNFDCYSRGVIDCSFSPRLTVRSLGLQQFRAERLGECCFHHFGPLDFGKSRITLIFGFPIHSPSISALVHEQTTAISIWNWDGDICLRYVAALWYSTDHDS